MDENRIETGNSISYLNIDLSGGAITDFHLLDGEINPLTFRFTKEQMPDNNKSGALYKGHFLCLGRWGEPSDGEIVAGVPNHGQAANIIWEAKYIKEKTVVMHAVCTLEGLQVDRHIQFDDHLPVYRVCEHVTNFNPLGRLYNMVQHPTIAHPFLDSRTIINCNADCGFNHINEANPLEKASEWPYGNVKDNELTNLSASDSGVTSLFSFIVNRNDNIGWITAYSPTHQLLLGYIWRRSHYPWINLWQDWKDASIRYRGLEFGTTGIHKPFYKILKNGHGEVFGENTFEYIDAGETVSRNYISFLHKVSSGFKGVQKIALSDSAIYIHEMDSDGQILLNSAFTNPL